MKIFAFIMAVIVFALSCMPCMDSNETPGMTKTEFKKSHNQPYNPISDDCSPFCQCNCCAGFSLPFLVTTVSLTIPETRIIHHSYYTASISRMGKTVWQPPKIG